MKQTKPPWLPHPPANPDWPDHVKRIYAARCERIDELRKQIDEDGCVPIPFRCYGCDETRMDFGMQTGDGVPLCLYCLGAPRLDHEETFHDKGNP